MAKSDAIQARDKKLKNLLKEFTQTYDMSEAEAVRDMIKAGFEIVKKREEEKRAINKKYQSASYAS